MKAGILSVAAIAAVLVPLTAWPAHATQPSLSINDVTVKEPRPFGSATMTFTASLDKPSDETVTVHFATSDPGDQIAPARGDLTFTPGASTASIPIAVKYSQSA